MERLVILESPYKGSTEEETEANIAYARKAVHDSLRRGEAPIAFHLLYTQEGILDDSVQKERIWGIEAALSWTRATFAETCVVYIDRGISSGMTRGIVAAVRVGMKVEFRLLLMKD